MKKLLFCAAMFAALMLTACGGGNQSANGEEQRNAEQPTYDEQQPTKQQKFQSADLRFHELQGHVSSVKYDEVTISFDIDGNQIRTEDDRFYETTRDDQGRRILYRVKDEYAKGDFWVYIEYRYDGFGDLTECEAEYYEAGSTTRYLYDEKGQLAKTISDWDAEGEEWKEVSTYKILETDSEGNWTKRSVHTEIEYLDWDEEVEPEDRVEKRVITYYSVE